MKTRTRPNKAVAASSRGELPGRCADALTALRRAAPRVHCVTNSAATAFTANILLAVGATPSLTIAEEEIGDFVASSDALLINLGTLDPQRSRAIDLALEVAGERSKPWLLDPVMIDRSASRLSLATKLVGFGPRVIRGNETEIKTLAECLGEIDAAGLAACSGATVIQTGPRDIVCCETETVAIDNGHPWMNRVTAMGCAGGALVAAFLALGGKPFAAAWEGVLTFSVAGELAGSGAEGPGSLQVRMLDTLNRMESGQILSHSRIRCQ